ncbi:hypothetical protein [Nonomuraea roseola]|uniref:Transposase n=1 Tax=Nonomuraea roseola TaxID=46179 RepID=A0ABV5QB25_9ACTN
MKVAKADCAAEAQAQPRQEAHLVKLHRAGQHTTSELAERYTVEHTGIKTRPMGNWRCPVRSNSRAFQAKSSAAGVVRCGQLAVADVAAVASAAEAIDEVT